MAPIKSFFLNIFYRIFHGRPYRPSEYNYPGNVEANKIQENRKKLIIKLLVIFGVPLMAFIIALFLIRIYHVEGDSMDPNFKDGQSIIVQKWDKTFDSIRGKQYVPKRFEVVVVQPPDEGQQAIKRVIGLPGERVIVFDGAVVIVSDLYPEGYYVAKDSPPGVVDFNERTEGSIDVKLGADEIFVLGDNREQSVDSRSFGPVKTEDIVGKYLDF